MVVMLLDVVDLGCVEMEKTLREDVVGWGRERKGEGIY